MKSKHDKLFVGLAALADLSGLPEPFLRAAANEGRIPSVQVGKRRLFSPAAVEQSLLQAAVGTKRRPARQSVHKVQTALTLAASSVAAAAGHHQ